MAKTNTGPKGPKVTTINGKKVVSDFFRNEQRVQVWEAWRKYEKDDKGVFFGWKPVGKYDGILPKGAKSLRLNIDKLDNILVEVGQKWQIEAIKWRCTEGQIDPETKAFIVYIDGKLNRIATEEDIRSETAKKNALEAAVTIGEDIEGFMASVVSVWRKEKEAPTVAVPTYHNARTAPKKYPRFDKKTGKEIFSGELVVAETTWTTKQLSWGMGYNADDSDMEKYAPILPEKTKIYRLNVRNAEELSPQEGETWTVAIESWHSKEDDVDKQNRSIVHLEGHLVAKKADGITHVRVERRARLRPEDRPAIKVEEVYIPEAVRPERSHEIFDDDDPRKKHNRKVFDRKRNYKDDLRGFKKELGRNFCTEE
jgi:hypothetical protein